MFLLIPTVFGPYLFDTAKVRQFIGGVKQIQKISTQKSTSIWGLSVQLVQKYLKAKLRKEQNEVVSDTTQLKLTASDGKKYKTDVISKAGVDKLAKAIRNQQAMAFLDWFTYSDNTIDGQSRKKHAVS